MIEVPDMDGKTVRATVEEISYGATTRPCSRRRERTPLARGNTADSRRSAGRAPLHGAVFGKDNARAAARYDPFDLYDWLLKAHAT